MKFISLGVERCLAGHLRVVWDGFGFGAAASGIYQHAWGLFGSLSKDCAPLVVLQPGAKFETAPTLVVGEPSLGRLARTKLVWPSLVYHGLTSVNDGAIRQLVDSGSWIFHGLSNLNLPLLPGLQKSNVRMVLTVHDLIPMLAPHSVSLSLNYQFRWALPRALDLADRIICVSHWTRRTLVEYFPKAERKIVVIPNGVRGSFANRSNHRSQLDYANGMRLISVGRFERYKRFDFLLDMAVKAPKGWHFTIVTDPRGMKILGKDGCRLLDQGVLELRSGLSESELQGAYRSADVYVHSSQFEGFCLPAIEALASGLPVVFKSGSAMDEYIKPPVGIGIPAYDHDAWIDAIQQVVHFSQSASSPEKIKEYVGRLPTWEDSAGQLENLYNEII